jgi:hypothetical protein
LQTSDLVAAVGIGTDIAAGSRFHPVRSQHRLQTDHGRGASLHSDILSHFDQADHLPRALGDYAPACSAPDSTSDRLPCTQRKRELRLGSDAGLSREHKRLIPMIDSIWVGSLLVR